MRVLMNVHRRGEQYLGSLTRESDHVQVQFVGFLELVAALERLQPDEPVEESPQQ
jgi:hypothetical protein